MSGEHGIWGLRGLSTHGIIIIITIRHGIIQNDVREI